MPDGPCDRSRPIALDGERLPRCTAHGLNPSVKPTINVTEPLRRGSSRFSNSRPPRGWHRQPDRKSQRVHRCLVDKHDDAFRLAPTYPLPNVADDFARSGSRKNVLDMQRRARIQDSYITSLPAFTIKAVRINVRHGILSSKVGAPLLDRGYAMGSW